MAFLDSYELETYENNALSVIDLISTAADEKTAALQLLYLPQGMFVTLYRNFFDVCHKRNFNHCCTYIDNMFAAMILVRKPYRKTNAGRDRIAADAKLAAIPDFGHLAVALAIAAAGQTLVMALWPDEPNAYDAVDAVVQHVIDDVGDSE
jgi:hypothetical protein